MKLNKLPVLFFVAFCSGMIFAKTKDYPANYYDVIALVFLLIIVFIFLAFLFHGTEEGKKSVKITEKNRRLFPFINKYITGTIPVEKEAEILLDDDYDGIKELDNRVPPWFNYLFYGSILFAVYYMLDYHVFETGMLQEEEYAQEMELARQQGEQLARSGAFITEETVTFIKDDETLSKGKQIYDTHCITCHAPDGGGLIGPNLTDRYWIHGGTINDVFKVIKYGVPAKGMIPWQQQLNPLQIQQVSSFILSLQGTDPQNPKPPEGNPAEIDTMKTISFR
jgi:cytochrome c oxidase cbb3-type subunit III